MFQEVLGHSGVSPYLPLIVFVLLVALGSDYNIFLMHRIREEAETLGMKDAVRIASGHTGAVITSAGLILAGTFGSMATAPLTMLFQVGVAVAIGVLIDTFLVRSILVPGDHDDRGRLGLVAVRLPVRRGGARARGRGGAWGCPCPWASPRRLRSAPARRVRRGAARGCGCDADLVGHRRGARRGRGHRAGGRAARHVPPPAGGGAGARRAACRVMVAGLLTWSLGGSDGNLGSVQAAVVNLDEGGTMTAADGTGHGSSRWAPTSRRR